MPFQRAPSIVAPVSVKIENKNGDIDREPKWDFDPGSSKFTK